MPNKCDDCGKFTSKKTGAVARRFEDRYSGGHEWEYRCQPCDDQAYPHLCEVFYLDGRNGHA